MSISALGAAVALGPRPRVEEAWAEPVVGPDVDAWLAAGEATVPRLRAGEAKSVLWADSASRARTALAVVYLHGFSADRHEVEPLVSDLARDLGANAYFARLTGHAQDGAALADATVEDWLADAAEALAVGTRIGERVVLVGTSTGATLALWTAARPEAADRVAALVLVSPNLGLQDRSSRVLLWPWGGLLARVLVGAERCFEPESEAQALHWTACYPTRALLPMMALVDHTRSLDLGEVRVPTLVVYSPRDAVVDPGETERLLSSLGGEGPTLFRVDDSGDPAHHVIAGDIMSPGSTDAVRERVLAFMESVRVSASAH
ncbi:MAG: alpha/beta fold hydrolase [Gemmatimonadetes bacterium]|nr:alpha/beta fold hydrolase [Gemmatimonadota bacterium]